jgi:hypothetical protein
MVEVCHTTCHICVIRAEQRTSKQLAQQVADNMERVALSRVGNWGLSPQLRVMPDAQTIIRCLGVRQRMEIYAGRGN